MRYFLALLGVVLAIVLVVVLIVHQGPKSATTNTASGPKVVHLTDYINKNSEVSLTTDGQINAQELHRSIMISVTPNSRTLTVYQGYDGSVLGQQTYANDTASYDSFMRALNNVNFIKERTGLKQTDERGVCATGDRFIYELKNDGKDVVRLWSTSCGNEPGTFAGIASTTRTLFQKQIPDYNLLVRDIAL